MLKKWIMCQKAQVHHKRAQRLFQSDMLEESIIEFTKAIEKDDTFLDAYHGRAIGRILTGDLEGGVSDMNFFIAHEPNNPSAYYYRSLGNTHLGKLDLALADANQSTGFDPDEPANYILRSLIYFKKKEYGLAIADATKGIEFGFVQDGHHSRAVYLEEMGDYDSSIKDWTKVIELSPNNAIAYCRRGLAQEKAGNLQAAISDLQTGLQLENQDRVNKYLTEMAKDLIEIAKQRLKALLNNSSK